MTELAWPVRARRWYPSPSRASPRAPEVSGKLTPYLLILPALIVLLLTVAFPLAYSLYHSFFYYLLFRPADMRWVGFGNYLHLLNDSSFWMSVRLSLIFTGVGVGLEVLIGILVALLMRGDFTGSTVCRLLLMTPMLMSPVVTGMTWRFLYSPDNGLINAALRLLGVPAPQWLTSPSTALLGVIIADIWQWTPFVFLVVYAGLQNVPRDILEAAQLDGAGYWRSLQSITMPMLKPVLAVVILIRLIDSIKTFDLVYVMTWGGPGTSTFLLSINNWSIGFSAFQIGRGAAFSYLVLLVITVLTTYLSKLMQGRSVRRVVA
jgi:multiple sugar transport system permease protein